MNSNGTELEQVVPTSSSIKILPKQPAERVWWTKSSLSSLQTLLLLIHFRCDSHYITDCGTAPIRQVTLYFSYRRGAALLHWKRKSPLTDHRSYV